MTERRSMMAERDTTDRYLAAYLADRVGVGVRGRDLRGRALRAVREARRDRRRRAGADLRARARVFPPRPRQPDPDRRAVAPGHRPRPAGHWCGSPRRRRSPAGCSSSCSRSRAAGCRRRPAADRARPPRAQARARAATSEPRERRAASKPALQAPLRTTRSDAGPPAWCGLVHASRQPASPTCRTANQGRRPHDPHDRPCRPRPRLLASAPPAPRRRR